MSQAWAAEWVVASGAAATIAVGTPTKRNDVDATTTGVTAAMVDGNGGLSASSRAVSGLFTGIAKTTSTDTAAANGIVDVWVPIPGLVYTGFAKDTTLANTQTLINALMGKRVVFRLTSSVWTVDSAAADALVNCVVIVGGNPRTSELNFMYSPKGTFLDTSTAITS